MAVNYKLIRSVIKDYFKIDKNPKKGLMTLEWVMLGYMAITIITMLFTYTKLVNPEAMLWGRLRVLVMTIALWAVYRLHFGFSHSPSGLMLLLSLISSSSMIWFTVSLILSLIFCHT